MPLNTLRLNHTPSSHPNDRIVFIKPLPRPPSQSSDYKTADNLLRAIAAQCLPIMKLHYLSVTTLEEHEPNSEFIGRNFNNGEIIQLVLRGKRGGWLPVNMIQMVMMHELAHNLHMNHGRDFWKARNLFAGEMKALWAKEYTGEGLWGSGRTLDELGSVIGRNVVPSEQLKDLPLCGGTYRSRRKKRKVKSDGLTWREQKKRRIEKKFGKNGVSLGEDEDKRLSLELSGRGPIGVKPRVAQSKRGRELRAAAALARFETNKKEVQDLDNPGKEEEETQSEDEFEDIDVDQEDAVDVNGKKMLDSKGQGMVKVCDEEEEDDVNVKLEMEELEGLNLGDSSNGQRRKDRNAVSDRCMTAKTKGKLKSLYDIPLHEDEKLSTKSQTERSSVQNHRTVPPTQQPKSSQVSPRQSHSSHEILQQPTQSSPSSESSTAPSSTTNPGTTTCQICSLTNPSLSATCQACGHVLDRRKDPRGWKCSGTPCQDSEYINAGDLGVCAVCGSRKGTNR